MAVDADDRGQLEERLEENPADYDGWLELARLKRQGRDPAGALAAANNALVLRPGSLDARYQRGLAQLELGLAGEAAACFISMLALQPVEPNVLIPLGTAYCYLRRFDEAVVIWEQAVRVAPEPVAVLEDLAVCHQRRRDLPKVAETWQRVLKLDPAHPLALHHLAALGALPAPERAAENYIAKWFDDFAPEFDPTLDALAYEGPRLLAELIEGHASDPPAGLRILDAGCGTGRCGPFLRRWADRLEGVDLSPGMLAKAAARDLYDLLHREEMTGFLDAHRDAFDLIVAADSLNYFGSLEAVIASMAAGLRARGRCAFFVERIAAGDAASHRLEYHGRFSHQPAYVLQCLIDAGLQVLAQSEAPVRNESGEAVMGALFLAGKP